MTTLTTKRWKEYMIGVFTEDIEITTPAIINKNDVVQFFIRILSQPPEDFPRKVTNITCFSTVLSSWGYQDNREGSYVERTERLKEFLKDSFIVFQPEQRNDFIIAKEVSLIPKSEVYHYDERFFSLPFIREEKEDFEKTIICGDWIEIDGDISSSQLKQSSYALVESGDGNLSIYGPFEYFEIKDEKIRFHTTLEVKSYPFKDEWVRMCSYYKGLIYLPEQLLSDLIEMMEEEASVIYEKGGNVHEIEGIDFIDDGSQESLFLKRFQQVTRKHHFHYELKDLINFHTSLKASNLVVLSGMSGTGKSKLVKMYGEALGLKNEQMLSIKVRPSWIDDSDLIGYLDVVNGMYDAGDSGLVELLLEAEKNQNKVFLVCFEEMNLARVEHYFSQFLSILESDERILTLYQPHRVKSIDSRYPPKVKIGKNVLFIGTVNIDDSTHVFSDKVLDRTNLMTLNVMPFYHLLDKPSIEEVDEEVAIDYEQYNNFQSNGQRHCLTHRELNCLWDVHHLLQEMNRNFGIGWRIIHQIDRYLNHLPNQGYFKREMAFDMQMVQRILPKIRGSEEQLKDLIGDYQLQSDCVEKGKLLSLLSSYEDLSDFTETKKCIIQKAKEIKMNGFTI